MLCPYVDNCLLRELRVSVTISCGLVGKRRWKFSVVGLASSSGEMPRSSARAAAVWVTQGGLVALAAEGDGGEEGGVGFDEDAVGGGVAGGFADGLWIWGR